MTYECFSLEIADHIAHIRLNRPEKANSMIPAFWSELPDAVEDISGNAKARVIVISSEGKHFSSGMDISVFMQGEFERDKEAPELDAEAFIRHLPSLQRTFSSLEKARQPVLAAVQGGALGGAIDLLTACDCRYATQDAFFCVQETVIGMTADVGTYPRLVKVIPEGWARQISYTGERLPAAKAKEVGLVNEVYPDAETMLAAVMEIAGQIAAHAPIGVTGCKQLINYSRDHTTADTLDYVGVWNASMLAPNVLKESFMAKMEKRAPEYRELKAVKKGL